MGDSGPLAVKPISIPTMFRETVKNLPDGLAMAHKRKGEWVKWTYKQYYDDVVKAAKSFIKVIDGLCKSHLSTVVWLMVKSTIA